MRNNFKILVGLAVVLAAAPAFAETISAIETADPNGTATPSTTLGDSTPLIIDYIASAPGTVDGYTYTNYALLVSDGTGYAEVYGKVPTVDTGYVPTVGDAIDVTGTWSPYDGIPELESLTSISAVSSGNAVYGPITTTIATLNANAAYAASTAHPGYSATSGSLITIDDATIGGATTFSTHANTTLNIEDSSVTSTVELYQWASSYSASGALGGTAVPTTANVTGIYDIYSSAPEIIPFTVTPLVPEPASLGLLAFGAIGLLARRRR